MFKTVAILNALLVLPFAASVLIAPDFTFGQFGIDLGAEGAGVARGYGATALGWGLICLMLLRAGTAPVALALFVASLGFNLAEVIVQLPIALSGIALPMIWSTVAGHAVLTVLSLIGLASRPAPA